eukprot:scaffold41674_cov56-Attheya_sp.AAC.3
MWYFPCRLAFPWLVRSMSTCTTYHFTIVSSRALCAMMNNLSREPAVAQWSCSSDMVACKESLTVSLRGAVVPWLPVYYVVHDVLYVGSSVALPLHWQYPPVRHLSSLPPSFPSSTSDSLPPESVSLSTSSSHRSSSGVNACCCASGGPIYIACRHFPYRGMSNVGSNGLCTAAVCMLAN